NVDKITDFLFRTKKEGAQLAVFSELTLCSYAPLDLVERSDFLEAHDAALLRLRDQLTGDDVPEIVVIGGLERNKKLSGRALHNSAFVFQKGELLDSYAKRLLPTYDVFDEARYFEPGDRTCKLDIKLTGGESLRLGISICEDAWFEQEASGRRRYTDDPAHDLRGCDLVVNLSASPFELNKRERRQSEISGFALRVGAPVVYVNQVGANDEILFDGASLVFDATGRKIFEAPVWDESLDLVELNVEKKEIVAPKISSTKKVNSSDPMEVLFDGLVVGIHDYFSKSGFSKAVIGLSGGIDSAVVAVLAAAALGPKNVLGVSLPGPYSSSHSLADAEELANKLGIEHRVHSIKFMNTAALMELKSSFAGLPPDVTEENLQSR
ncbi:MAG TPA: nitrilase-related carbon-nitrogen hydrolase, partial [Oligoflexia bacterium]|nr:nitrilase-related carbon-nitrogen hydrolase [Oligoflexia bacterium]